MLTKNSRIRAKRDTRVRKAGSQRPLLDSLAITLANVAGQVSMLIFVVLLARHLAVSEVGAALTNIAIASILVAAVDFGTNNQWLIQLSNASTSREEWLNLASKKILISGILAVSGYVILEACKSPYYPVLPIFFGLLLHQTAMVYLKVFDFNTVFALLLGLERPIALLILQYSFMSGVGHTDSYSWALFIGTTTTASFAVGIIIRDFPRKMAFGTDLKANPWKGSFHYGVTSLAGASKNLDVVFVNSLFGPFDSGLYGTVSKWFQPIYATSAVAATVSTPWIASKADKRPIDFAKAALPMLFTCMLAAVICLYPGEAVIAVLGKEYSSSATYLMPLGIGAVFGGIFNLLANWSQARGYQTLISKLSVAQIVAQYLLGFCLAPTQGLFAFCWVVALTNLLAAISSLWPALLLKTKLNTGKDLDSYVAAPEPEPGR